MAKGIMAMIIPIDSGAHPDHGLPTPQPPGGSPGAPDQTLPGDLPRPSHPIFYPLPPGAPVHPDQGLPGDQPHPDQGLPPHASHPIVLPPDSGGWQPVYIWGPGDPRPGSGLPGSQPHPDQGLPPIELPPEGELPAGAHVEWKAMWTPTTGWVSFAIVVPSGPAPTPSKRK